MMKKALLLIVGLTMSMIASAYTCVTFKQGDPSILLQKVTIAYEIDWDHARVTNYDNLLFPDYLKKRGDDFVRDWPKDRKQAEKYFTVRFNKKSDYMRINPDATSEAYKMVVRISSIDVGNGGGTFNPWASSKAGGCIINGTIEFYDQAGSLVCVLNIIEAKGTGTPSETTRYGLVLSEIAGDLCDFIEDDVEKGKVQATSVSGSSAAAPVTTTAATATAVTQSAATTNRPASTAKPAAKPAAAKPATTQSATVAASDSDSEVRVTLKNGSVIIGKMKAFDPTKSITVSVAGVVTTIPMSEVSHIESSEGNSLASATPASSTSRQSAPVTTTASANIDGKKLKVTDNGNYPATYEATISNQKVRMLLVRGGHMNMGYDGRGSRAMMSEPVHEVAVTSFYISEDPLPASLVLRYISDRNVEGKNNEPAQIRDFNDVDRVVSTIQSHTGKRFRLPTEAEWEYAACSDLQNVIFLIAKKGYTAYEWTGDVHDYFPDNDGVLTDPTGPMGEGQRVIRAYNNPRGKFDRSNEIDEDDAYLGLVRLVIKAKDI